MGTINMAVVRERKRKMVRNVVDIFHDNYKKSGSELVMGMTTVQIAMLSGTPYTALRDAVIAHPTMSEGLIFLLHTVPPKLHKSEGEERCTPEIASRN